MNRCPRCRGMLLRDGTCLAHGEPSAVATAAPIQKRDPHRAWTEEDEAFALEHMHSLTARQIAVQLGRSHKAVKHKFSRWGISKPRLTGQPRAPKKHWARGSRLRQPWTEEEETALEAGDLKLLAMSRSFSATKVKATRMGCPIRSGDGCLSQRQVAEQYGVHRVRMREWIDRGLLPAKKSGRMWRIDPAVAERLVPLLKKATRANHGRNGWWTK